MASNLGGAPAGNSNAAKGKRWLNAINKALEERTKTEQQDALVKLAKELLKKCDSGDLAALQELGNRLDGKPNQSVEAKVEHSGQIEHKTVESMNFEQVREQRTKLKVVN
ncbi:MAG: hypothetical protein OES84_00180 [Kiritimatiellaceae bacterium]|nr:hypothetical protein [Kiritimatiellaceae bacterium]